MGPWALIRHLHLVPPVSPSVVFGHLGAPEETHGATAAMSFPLGCLSPPKPAPASTCLQHVLARPSAPPASAASPGTAEALTRSLAPPLCSRAEGTGEVAGAALAGRGGARPPPGQCLTRQLRGALGLRFRARLPAAKPASPCAPCRSGHATPRRSGVPRLCPHTRQAMGSAQEQDSCPPGGRRLCLPSKWPGPGRHGSLTPLSRLVMRTLGPTPSSDGSHRASLLA